MADDLTGTSSIPVWLLADPDVAPKAKIVYLALLTFIDRNGECWPAHTAIAARSALSVSTVKRALEQLREQGVVTWRARWRSDTGQTSNHYTLRLQ
jgi:hypothetical protein